MRSNAAPGPDGLNAAFYKASWDWIAKYVHGLVVSFYMTKNLPAEINCTHIALIPKTNSPLTPKDYRLISLCNVAYKIIAKSLIESSTISRTLSILPNVLVFMVDILPPILLLLKKLFIVSILKVGIKKLFS